MGGERYQARKAVELGVTCALKGKKFTRGKGPGPKKATIVRSNCSGGYGGEACE